MLDRENEEFIKYTNDYLKYGDKVYLKVEHTFRVVQNAIEIAKSLNLNEADIHLAALCALLHDIGRFEQVKRFDSFSDKFIDHADLGVEILKNNNYLYKYNNDRKLDDLILKSIKYHNKYSIPNNLSEKEKLFCNIVRDADKIDILYLYNTEINFSLDDSKFSDKVFNSLINKNIVNKKDKITKVDSLAIPIGFIFDINYEYSKDVINKKKYIVDFIDKYINKTKNKEFIRQLENVKEAINSV